MSHHGEIKTEGDIDLDDALEVVQLRREEKREAMRAFLEGYGVDPDEVLPF